MLNLLEKDTELQLKIKLNLKKYTKRVLGTRITVHMILDIDLTLMITDDVGNLLIILVVGLLL